MKTIDAWWEELGAINVLVVSCVDNEGNDTPEELMAAWTRDSLQELKATAAKLGCQIWDGESGVII